MCTHLQAHTSTYTHMHAHVHIYVQTDKAHLCTHIQAHWADTYAFTILDTDKNVFRFLEVIRVLQRNTKAYEEVGIPCE